MAILSERLALALGLPEVEAERIGHAAVLHDVGKVGIPDRVLRKRGLFDGAERALMQTHAAVGAEILDGSDSELIQLAAVIARSHHERWDGTGYPDRLAGEAIPLPARICAVADVFDALLAERTYKPGWPLQDALDELLAQRGAQFDPAVIDAFLALVPTLEPELVAPAPPPQVGVLTAPAAEPPTRSRSAAGSAPADAGDTSSSRPAAPSPPARG